VGDLNKSEMEQGAVPVGTQTRKAAAASQEKRTPEAEATKTPKTPKAKGPLKGTGTGVIPDLATRLGLSDGPRGDTLVKRLTPKQLEGWMAHDPSMKAHLGLVSKLQLNGLKMAIFQSYEPADRRGLIEAGGVTLSVLDEQYIHEAWALLAEGVGPIPAAALATWDVAYEVGRRTLEERGERQPPAAEGPARRSQPPAPRPAAKQTGDITQGKSSARGEVVEGEGSEGVT
jgi:hypothetical protein